MRMSYENLRTPGLNEAGAEKQKQELHQQISASFFKRLLKAFIRFGDAFAHSFEPAFGSDTHLLDELQGS